MQQLRIFLFVPLVFFLFITCSSTRKHMSLEQGSQKDPRWVQVDSLSDQGLYASALEKTEVILDDARRSNDWRTEFRAWDYRSRFQELVGMDIDTSLIAMEERAGSSVAPLRQLLYSVVAEAWWNRYQSDRWEILERTNMEVDGTDPATWTQATFMKKVIASFETSLEPAAALKDIPVGELGDLLQNNEGEKALRPTLYDVLAHRALAVFKNSETRITEAAWRFTLNEPGYFDLFEPFALRTMHHRDSTAWEFKAMQLYQALERMHLSDDKPDALVDVSLERLQFVRSKSTLPDKDSLYLHALETLQSRLVHDTTWAEVTVAIAEVHVERGDNYQRLTADPNKWEKRTAQALCDSAIAKFPGSFGAKNALALKAGLERSALDIKVEQAAPLNAISTVALGYTNTNKVWFRVVMDPMDVNGADQPRQDYSKYLLARPVVLEWSVDLLDDGDLQRHVIELPVAGLPFGHYAIIASDGQDFLAERDAIVHAQFWVTGFAISERDHSNQQDLLVLDRETGAVREGVKVEAWFRSNNYSEDRKFKRIAELTTNAEGVVTFPMAGERGMIVWVISDGKDRYQTGSSWHYSYAEQPEREQVRSYLFTDRAIYRPGQEIFFKGIVTSQKGKENYVVPSHKAKVVLYDVNGQQVDTMNVTSDAFGAYHGTFRSPVGSLTGAMRIDAGSGSRSIQVEEYKRPTFEVIFDPITSAAKLEQEATVTGVAKSYAGVPLDGANVQWKVERRAQMPWWCGWGWRGLPWGQSTEIATGEAPCDAEGKFSIAFEVITDHSFPKNSDPLFTYTVEASATDINGETQTNTTTLNAGYRSIEIAIELGEAIDRNVVDSLGVFVRNLNGEDMDVPMDIRIVELVPPFDAPQRERLWERPDRAYEGELPTTHLTGEPLSWPVQREHLVLQGHRAAGRSMLLKGVEDWTVGMYRIEVGALDPDGNEVKVSKLFTVYDTEIQNTGFVNEAFHVQSVKTLCEPGEKAVFLISSALPEGRILMEVERGGKLVVSRWFVLNKAEQRIELPVLESDRGGFAVHFLSVERGRAHSTTERVDVPWTNKQLNVEWISFRDKLLPGSKEEWRLRITGPKKERVTAQLLAVMYDASLDHFVEQSWDMFQWPTNSFRLQRYQNEPFGTENGREVYRTVEMPGRVQHVYQELEPFEAFQQRNYRYRFASGLAESDGVFRAMPGMVLMDKQSAGQIENAEAPALAKAFEPAVEDQQRSNGPPPLRTDFRETAFFFPDLLTDRDGSVMLRFTAPDALTRWNVMGLAHTKGLRFKQFEKQATTSKPLMVVPNLPRFFREGDRMDLTAKINVTESDNLQGTVAIAFFDPVTNENISGKFGLVGAAQPFTAGVGKSANVAWTITVPAGVGIASVRITATAAGMGDGEEHPIPVLTDKVLITESIPIAISKAGTKTFRLDKLINSAKPLKNGQQHTLQSKLLKLEYTPNPAWYAVQALPYLMEFPHECAEQIFSRYYANRLASHIVEQRPAIRNVFETWKNDAEKDKGPDAFLSALEKNTELKNVLLEETPWVVNAKDEGERKSRIALFFDLQRMATEEAVALRKLSEMQLPDGAFPWWSGMRPSRYITQHIVAGFGHLEALRAADLRVDGSVQQLLKNAVEWLDNDVEKEYAELVRRSSKETLANYTPSGNDIQFLYARSFFQRWPINAATHTAVEFYTNRAKATWLQRSLQEQAMLALAFARMKDDEAAMTIMRSLSERATRNEELGMFWKGAANGVEWWNFPTETHALMIEAFHEVANDSTSVDALRQYLLKLKQTTDWKTTKATAEACYALLLTGNDLLDEKNPPAITMGKSWIIASAQEAGTGYFTRTWSGTEVTPAMGEVTVTTKENGSQWGALHWQYLEQMDKVTPHESPFRIEKKVMLHAQSDEGAQLIELKNARSLMAGDKLTIRIVLSTDRYVDYVHLKDLRAAGLEPVEAISGYKWQGGLGYYQSIKDVAMHFFFDRISPGTYVFEYDLRVTHAGDFSNGVTTAMCMYAPEFSSHSEGVRVKVGK